MSNTGSRQVLIPLLSKAGGTDIRVQYIKGSVPDCYVPDCHVPDCLLELWGRL